MSDERNLATPRPKPAGASCAASAVGGSRGEALDSRTARSPTAEAPRAPAGGGAVSPSGGRPPTARPRRPWTRRVRRALATVLIVAGTLLIADGATTLLWQEPASSLYAHWQQDKLERQLADLEHASATRVERHALARIADPRRRLASAARAFGRRTHDGGPLARLRIPSIGVSAVVVEGTGSRDLRAGPGHYATTPLPGERGTVAIAGHRTTMGAWFRNVDRLRPADRIELVLPYGRFTYRVQGTRIVPPTALWITKRVGYDRLVLSACHPLFSASERIVVFARLVTGRPAPAVAKHTTRGPGPL
jgi:sortase A